MSELRKRISGLRTRVDRFQSILFARVLSYLSLKLRTQDGIVIFNPTNIGVISAIDRALKNELDKELKRLQKYILKDVRDHLKNEIQYFNSIDPKAIETSQNVIKRAEKHLSNKVLVETDLSQIYGEVKNKSISMMSRQNGISLQELRGYLEKEIVDKNKIQSQWSRWTYDIYQQYERVASNEIRKELGLKWAMYEGGEIETSRCFCIKRNGRLFREDEIMMWNDETWAGKSEIGYDAIVDLGGFNCRHKLRWVSDDFAERRQDIIGVNPNVVCSDTNTVKEGV
jgi:hypothetical protein